MSTRKPTRYSSIPIEVQRLKKQILKITKEINNEYSENLIIKKYMDIIHRFSYKILKNSSIYVYDQDYINFLKKKLYVLDQLFYENNIVIIKNFIIYLYLTIIYKNYAGIYSKEYNLKTYFTKVNRPLETKFLNAFTYLKKSKSLNEKEFELYVKTIIDKLISTQNLDSNKANFAPNNKKIIDNIATLIFDKKNESTRKRKHNNNNQNPDILAKKSNTTISNKPSRTTFTQSPIHIAVNSNKNLHQNLHPNLHINSTDTSRSTFNDQFEQYTSIQNYFDSLR